MSKTLESTDQIQPKPVSLNRYLKAPATYYCLQTADQIIHRFADGQLNVNSNQAITPFSQFPLFSITKTFTAIAIMQLVETGELQLDDELASYLPIYSKFGRISVRQLLSHQSGLNNPLPLSWVHLAEEDVDFDYQSFPSQLLQTKGKIRSKPGVKAAYSNLNFLLLGELIEQISGFSYRQYMEEQLLKDYPGIGFYWDDDQAVTGYHDAGFSGWLLGLLMDKSKYTAAKVDGLIPFKKLYLNGSAYGGLLVSPAALDHFLQDLLSGKVLNPISLDLMFEEQPLANGKSSGHSLGWFTGRCQEQPYCHHAGGGGGFYLELRIYPALGTASYVLTNKSGFSDQRLLDKIDPHFLSH